MEKPNICPDCGGVEFTLDSMPVIAEMVATFDARGRETNLPLPTRTLSLSVAAWCCDNCDHADVDEEDIRAQVTRETHKMVSKAMAELN
jgi:hypothetical protein